jgi:aspartate/methionine/tyrosine aminotransferase
MVESIPGYEPPQALLQALTDTSTKSVHQYAPGTGNMQLRELLLEKYSSYGFTHEQLLVTQGATEAVSLIVTYLKNIINGSFSAMAFDPVYESYRHVPRIMQIPFIACKSTNFDINAIEKCIVDNNVRILFLNSPGNPLGKVYTKEQMEALRRLCEWHKVYLIIDAVYKELYFDEPAFYPIENLSEFIFYVNSFSKSLSITGWRIGYFFAHESHATGLRDIHDYIGLCVNSPLQEALATYLAQENFGHDYIAALRNQLRSAYYKMSESLVRNHLSVSNANGGYYVWAQLPGGGDGFQFAMELYEKSGVAVIPGEHFSDDSVDFIRLNIARPQAEVDKGIQGIETFFGTSERE